MTEKSAYQERQRRTESLENETAARTQVEETLEERLRFQELASRLSAVFINLPAGEVDQAVHDALRKIGEYFGADLVGMARLSVKGELLTAPHVWLSKHYDSEKARRYIGDRIHPNVVAHLKSEGSLVFSKTDEYPDWSPESEFVRYMGIKAAVTVKLAFDGFILDAFTVDIIRSTCDWPRDIVPRVQFLGQVLSNALNRKKAEEELSKQREALARVGRANRLGQLTGSIAHELNQPLAGILSNAQATELMIKQGRLEQDELEEIMADIVNDTKRAGEVIRNLRNLYREQKVEFIPIDINVVIDETIRLLHSEFVIQNVELTTDCTPSLPLVNGNRIQIQQILVNLIMNSNQAMKGLKKKKRRLHIASAYEGIEVKVWVEDNGTGIKTEFIDKIFEPLLTWKSGGMGMGLAISHSIIESHGGKMWAENRPEGGAQVGFVIPAMKGGGQT